MAEQDNETLETYKMVLNNGTIYKPPGKHYNDDTRLVKCDSCKSICEDICLGYKTYDLCTKCVNEASKKIFSQKNTCSFIDDEVLLHKMNSAGIQITPLDNKFRLISTFEMPPATMAVRDYNSRCNII